MSSRKRDREDRGGESSRRRKSRFSDGPDPTASTGPPPPAVPPQLLNMQLPPGPSPMLNMPVQVPGMNIGVAPVPNLQDPTLAAALLASGAIAPQLALPSGDDPASRAARAAMVQAQVAQQIESVSSALDLARQAKIQKKARDFSLRLDEQGREVDEKGHVVKVETQVKTLKANLDIERFENNPYMVKQPKEAISADPRLKERSRNRRAARAFQFVQQGTYVKQGEAHRNREARKLMAGFLSGRNPNAKHKEEIAHVDEDADEEIDSNFVEVGSRNKGPSVETIELPEAIDHGPVPLLEWWDEPFLSEGNRLAVKKGQKPLSENDLNTLDLRNTKTWRYVQHPVPLKQATAHGIAKPKEVVMPVYLTKKERKRLRRQARLEREREKQDKIALGLIAPPEPKMKLSNFMKVIGEQAVADPSKVEKMVMAQVKQRERNHEMRNQARKLTPQERKDKKRKKIVEDNATAIQVAVFRVRDMSDPQKRFKVDVNAQQNHLTGGVLLCKTNQTNLVVVEGGPKAVKRFVKLMIRRIKWVEERSDAESESDSEDDEDRRSHKEKNECKLVWQGTVLKKAFQAFRFQECKTSETARKVMETKGVAHYWDMVINDSSAPTDAI